jgi:hypothetical protein
MIYTLLEVDILHILFVIFQFTNDLFITCSLENDLCQGIQHRENRDTIKHNDQGNDAASRRKFPH